MNSEDLKKRTKLFAVDVIRLVESLPKTKTGNVIGNQLIRSGTSVGANYRAACRAKSKADFINKLKIVEEEADESIYWMELLEDAKVVESSKLNHIKKEADELLAIFVASITKAKGIRN
jgi:four helix bundle protein